jgi:hypothetical protein
MVRNEAGSHRIKLFEHPLEIKVKYIHRGDGGIGRRNGLKIKTLKATDTPYR